MAPQQRKQPFFIDKVTSMTADGLQYPRKPSFNASTMWVTQTTHIFSQ